MSGRFLRLVCTAATAALAAGTVLAPISATAVPDPAAPGSRSLPKLLTDLQRLYREAEKATETYNATEEQLTRQRARTERLENELALARLSLQDSRGAAGRLARQQYQSVTGVSPYVRLLLARDPQHALDQGHVIGQLTRERAETVGRLVGSEKKADDLARRARKALDDQLTLAARRQKVRDDVHRRLRSVEGLLSSLTAQQLTALAEFEKKGVDKAQGELMTSGALKDDAKPPPGKGDRAVRYAFRQLGKPYEWGAEGPESYDCSGLTSEAWRSVGVPIPRTSQEQWARLPKIPLDRLRPGDLVVYFPEATHVAVYVGKGQVVQAPRPGTKITISPIASNPILGAVRPDAPQRPRGDKIPSDHHPQPKGNKNPPDHHPRPKGDSRPKGDKNPPDHHPRPKGDSRPKGDKNLPNHHPRPKGNKNPS
ncbi:NlpC/P60 family protein [Streptomyces sp. NPDC006332]|uniref:C40 family peptidase n=1 Tax=Streptomyces sp. NPDC006332 TaxID=3155456 RepID=UPI0033BF8A64